MRAPLFRALHALAADDGDGRARLSPGEFAALHVERVVDPLQSAVPLPAAEIAMHRAAGRQVLRDRAPLTAGGEHVHDAVDDRALVDLASASAMLGRRDQRCDQHPFRVGQVARIAQVIAVVATAILNGPHAGIREAIMPHSASRSRPGLKRQTANHWKNSGPSRTDTQAPHQTESAAQTQTKD